MKISLVDGDLLHQDVEVIVNAWNQNLIPWWLLLPQGVSGAIKRQAGYALFHELARLGKLRLGQAALTSAGKLPYNGIIHVAGINLLWRASEYSIRESVRNAMRIVADEGFSSIAFPIIGAGSGGFPAEKAQEMMLEEFAQIESVAHAIIVRYKKMQSNNISARHAD